MKYLNAFAFAVILICARGAGAHDPEGGNQYSQWFMSQRQNNAVSLCCGDIDENGGDAHYVDVSQSGGNYYVRVGESWVLYPLPVNPYLINPTGHNVAWYRKDGEKIRFYCLRLAGGA